jgi:hypothetical protein
LATSATRNPSHVISPQPRQHMVLNRHWNEIDEHLRVPANVVACWILIIVCFASLFLIMM